MKATFIGMFKVLLAAGFTVLFAHGCQAAPVKKVAVLVGINDYRQKGGNCEDKPIWCDLEGTHNDIEIIGKELKKRGFTVHMLRDASATRAGILSAIRTHLLESPTVLDSAYFHFSGHGQQIDDDNDDEQDGCDESLVPYDHRGMTDGTNNLRDDELGVLFKKVAKRHRSFLVTFDSCHSGTATRAASSEAPKRRGGPGCKGCRSGQCGVGTGFLGATLPYAFLSSTQPLEWAHETLSHHTNDGRNYGAFSYEWARLLRESEVEPNYLEAKRTVEARLKHFYGYEQHPSFEGPYNRVVFSSKSRDTGLMAVNGEGGRYIIDGGPLNNVLPGALVGVYPKHVDRGDWRSAPVVLEVERSVTDGTSVAQLSSGDRHLAAQVLKSGGVAKMIRPSTTYGARIALLRTGLDAAALSAAKGVDGVILVDKPGSKVYRVRRMEGGYQLLSGAGRVTPVPKGEDLPMTTSWKTGESHRLGFALERLYRLARLNTVRNLGDYAGIGKEDIRVELIEDARPGVGFRKSDDGGRFSFSSTDSLKAAFRVKVTNQTNRPLQANIVWAFGDGGVYVMPIESNQRTATLAAGGTRVFPSKRSVTSWTATESMLQNSELFVLVGSKRMPKTALDEYAFLFPKGAQRGGGSSSTGKKRKIWDFGASSIKLTVERR